jgi:hypothetical protein
MGDKMEKGINIISEHSSHEDRLLMMTAKKEHYLAQFKNCRLQRKELEAKNEQLAEQLKEARKHLAESVSRECKCEVNTSVNNDLVNRNLGLKQQLKEANVVIDMVEDNTKMPHQHKDYYERLCCLSERANEYKTKYKVKE